MSYSYIKSVFPNFEDSSKVYDDAIYSNILSAKGEEKTHDTSNYSVHSVQQNDQYYNSDKETFILPQTNLLETFNNNTMNTSNKIEDVNNLQLNSQTIQLSNKNLNPIEKFEGGEDCDKYVNHITNCDRCRSIIMKQLNIESDNKRNEELMELISYLIFAIFILLLVNSLKTPR
jgi:hypothetical protein